MLNYQIKTQNIAYSATFLVDNHQMSLIRAQKRPAQADEGTEKVPIDSFSALEISSEKRGRFRISAKIRKKSQSKVEMPWDC